MVWLGILLRLDRICAPCVSCISSTGTLSFVGPMMVEAELVLERELAIDDRIMDLLVWFPVEVLDFSKPCLWRSYELVRN